MCINWKKCVKVSVYSSRKSFSVSVELCVNEVNFGRYFFEVIRF